MAVTKARKRAENYLLERRMFRSLRTGEVIDKRWLRFSFPAFWHYDVLRGLDYLRNAGIKPDSRVGDAIEIVIERRHQNGRWPLNLLHPEYIPLEMETGVGRASRWNTLRALRVLAWDNNILKRDPGGDSQCRFFAASFITQRNSGICLHGAPGWDPACEERDDEQDGRRARHGRDIVWRYPYQLRLQNTIHRERDARPTTRPIATGNMPSRRIIFRTSPAAAPIAMRMPISLVRRLTEWAIAE